MVRKISFLLLLIYMSVFSVAGRNITFNHLSTDDGLSQFSVNGLYIDEKGWRKTIPIACSVIRSCG